MNTNEILLDDFMAIDGDTLLLRGPAARLVLYSALVTALTANDTDHPICVSMPEREHLALDWARIARALYHLDSEHESITKQ